MRGGQAGEAGAGRVEIRRSNANPRRTCKQGFRPLPGPALVARVTWQRLPPSDECLEYAAAAQDAPASLLEWLQETPSVPLLTDPSMPATTAAMFKPTSLRRASVESIATPGERGAMRARLARRRIRAAWGIGIRSKQR